MHMSCSPIPKRMWMWWDGWWDAKFGDFVSASRNVWVTMILMVVRCGKSRFSWPFSLKHVKHAYAFYAHQLISSTRREQNGNCNRYKSSFPECYRWIKIHNFKVPSFLLKIYFGIPVLMCTEGIGAGFRSILRRNLLSEFSLWSCLRHLRPFVHCSATSLTQYP